MSFDLQKHYSTLLARPDSSINLAEQALLFARLKYPGLDTNAYLHCLDQYAEDIRHDISLITSPQDKVAMLNNYLFEVQGFAANLLEFKDPKNSYLNEVIDRKLGIPISLSLVYIEVGRRLGLDMHGVSFPGHFLVRLNSIEEYFILDPFSRGMILDNRELTTRLSHFPEYSAMNWTIEDHLTAARPCDFLSRMLRNLKLIFIENQDHNQALNIINLILALNPKSADDFFDRAEIFESMECYTAACSDLEKFLALKTGHELTPQIKKRIHELRNTVQTYH